MGVNLSNGNLHLELGAGTCVTCGAGGGGPVYPNPQDTKLRGPVFVYNTMGTRDSDLGPKWMLPYDAYLTVVSNVVTLVDADGTTRIFTESGGSSPQHFTAAKEDCTLVRDGSDYTLTRKNGDRWIFDVTNKNRVLMKLLVPFVLTLCCISCGSKPLHDAKFFETNVRRGMTKEEVIKVLGKPEFQAGASHGFSREVWKYDTSDQAMEAKVFFESGVVDLVSVKPMKVD